MANKFDMTNDIKSLEDDGELEQAADLQEVYNWLFGDEYDFDKEVESASKIEKLKADYIEKYGCIDNY
jgi:hypothetical protein